MKTPPEDGAIEARHVLFSVNPKAGRRCVAAEVEQTADLLHRAGCRVTVGSNLAEIADQANREWAAGTLRAVVGVGGDGTAAELANRLTPETPLAVYPAGTSNLLARHLGITRDPPTMVDMILHGPRIRFDAGRANGRLFLLMASCGFDAAVVERVHERRRTHCGGHISYRSYVGPIFGCIRSYRYPEIRVYLEDCDAPGGAAEPLSVRWAFVCNIPNYGWGAKIAPAACGTDGRLNLCTFRRGGLLRGLRYAWALQRERHERLADCTAFPVRRVRLESSEPVAYQLDGDPIGALPLTIEVEPQRVTLVVPPGTTQGE